MPELLKKLMARHSSERRQRSRLLKQFADKIGLVYFGQVDQHKDEHDVIRGLTASIRHVDDHYAVGSYDGYDIAMVDRFDTHTASDGSATEHSWLILEFTLTEQTSMPRAFLRPTGQSDPYLSYLIADGSMHLANGLLESVHSAEFHARYELYATSTHVPLLETLLTNHVTQIIAARMWPLGIELNGNKLVIYILNTKLSEPILETCLDSGLWLARTLDGAEV